MNRSSRTNQVLYFARLSLDDADKQSTVQLKRMAEESALHHLYSAVNSLLSELVAQYRLEPIVSIDELFEKYSVGIVRTYTYPKDIDEAIKKYPHHVEGAPNELSLLNKLSVGRGDVVITDPQVIQYLAKKEGIFNIETVKVVMKKELVLAFRDDEENRIRLKLLAKLLKKT